MAGLVSDIIPGDTHWSIKGRSGGKKKQFHQVSGDLNRVMIMQLKSKLLSQKHSKQRCYFFLEQRCALNLLADITYKIKNLTPQTYPIHLSQNLPWSPAISFLGCHFLFNECSVKYLGLREVPSIGFSPNAPPIWSHSYILRSEFSRNIVFDLEWGWRRVHIHKVTNEASGILPNCLLPTLKFEYQVGQERTSRTVFHMPLSKSRPTCRRD